MSDTFLVNPDTKVSRPADILATALYAENDRGSRRVLVLCDDLVSCMRTMRDLLDFFKISRVFDGDSATGPIKVLEVVVTFATVGQMFYSTRSD